MIKWTGALLLATAAMAFAQPDDRIQRILADRIDRDHKALGMVVGIIDGDGRKRVLAHGDVKADSIFEIGSVTKVFTALVLADMAQRGEVALTDPVAKYLPEGVPMPRKGRAITLEDLATNMSGLPRLPNNMTMTNMANPYADYTAQRLYDFLRAYQLPREPGAKWEYSNLGFGLLGHVLARRAGNDYESMVRLRVTGPLDMVDTQMADPVDLKERLATGHSVQLQKVGYWTFDALAGAGAFRSDADDLLEFLAANLGHKRTGLAPAMAAMLKPRPATGQPIGQALGWNTLLRNDVEFIWKDGGTAGFSSIIAFDQKRRAGVVVLSNTSGDVSDIAFHLLDARNPLRTFTATGAAE